MLSVILLSVYDAKYCMKYARRHWAVVGLLLLLGWAVVVVVVPVVVMVVCFFDLKING